MHSEGDYPTIAMQFLLNDGNLRPADTVSAVVDLDANFEGRGFKSLLFCYPFFVAKSIDFINPSLTEHSAPDEEAQSTLRCFYRMN